VIVSKQNFSLVEDLRISPANTFSFFIPSKEVPIGKETWVQVPEEDSFGSIQKSVSLVKK